MKKIVLFLLVCVFFTGCANPNDVAPNIDQSFLSGFWDGLTIYFAFIGKLFGFDYSIYEMHNSGTWYDLGYVFGVGSAFSLVIIPKVIKFFISLFLLIIASLKISNSNIFNTTNRKR